MCMKNPEKIYALFLAHSHISTDTRELEKGSLFFALSGENFNGNRFAAEAVEKGAVAAIVDDPEFAPKNDSRFYLVDNTLDILQKLATFHRQQFDIPVLAITGTNGKTTTKELCSAVLSSGKNICFTQGNFNNHIGVPLTLLNIRKETEVAIIEMGANHPGEIENLCRIARPTHGLITNIGKAHLEGFGDFQCVINAKNELYKFIKQNNGTLFVNKDNPLLMKLSEGIQNVTYGQPPADVEGSLRKADPFIDITWHRETGNTDIQTQLYGSYNFSNVMAATAVGKYFGISESDIIGALKSYQPQNNRSQFFRTQNNTLILDAYNANPESMALAIDDFAAHQFSNPVLILGDMFELGKAAEEEHNNIVEKLKKSGFQHVILVGKDFYKTAPGNLFQKFATTSEAEQYLRSHPVRNAYILVKGSRGMQLEKLIQYL
ncbi:MAG: UDP-N-acetylmuramoyl-tripeptide--D-alanyl-D-alanine ligase [bacterium]|nr:MAG: UDP-N-acetylmuramoyl-tripeptide--D-alanyl-D-alanine ligase [bacterium]